MFIEKEDLELKKFMTRDKPNKNNHPRIGEINYNFYGSPMIIVDYRNSIDIDVCIINIMKNGKINYYIVYNRSYDKFLKGCMKSPYDLSCCNTGYLGEGYRPKDIPIIYRCWLQMINRSCSVNFKNLCNTYIKVTVDKRFHNFQPSWEGNKICSQTARPVKFPFHFPLSSCDLILVRRVII